MCGGAFVFGFVFGIGFGMTLIGFALFLSSREEG